MRPTIHRRRTRRAALGLSLLASTAVLAAGCGSANETASEGSASESSGTVSVTHAQGTTEVPVKPSKVIVYDLAALDTIDALGVGDAVHGTPVESVPEVLEAYAGSDMLNAGTLFEPDYEKVAAAKPDLIIVGSRSAAVYKDLEEIAPTIDLTVDATTFQESLRTNTEILGKIFDVEEVAADKLEALDESIAEVADAAKDAGTGLVILTSGGKLSAYGEGSRFGFVHDPLGIAPAKEDIKVEGPHGEAASFEYVLTANPDHLFVIDRDSVVSDPEVEAGPAAEKLLDNDIVDRTAAAKNGNIHYLDATNWYILGGGLTSFAAMVDEVGEAIGA